MYIRTFTIRIGTRSRSRNSWQLTISVGGGKRNPWGENSTRSTGYCLTETARYAFG